MLRLPPRFAFVAFVAFVAIVVFAVSTLLPPTFTLFVTNARSVAQEPPADVRATVYAGNLASLVDRGPGGRRIVGIGAPYNPTSTTPNAVNENMLFRRAVAWAAVDQVFAPYVVTLEDGATDIIPSFLSWYTEDEIIRIMIEMVNQFQIHDGATGFTNAQILEHLDTRGKRLREGPRDFAPIPRETLERLGPGIPPHLGTHNVFSPGFVTHILRHIQEIADCMPEDGIDYILEKATGLRQSFSPCMSREFPRDAIMFKPTWKPVNNNTVDVSAYPTGPTTMRQLLGPLEAGETRMQTMPSYDPRDGDLANPETPTDPDALNAENFYVVQDSEGTRHALRNLHVVTKEIDEWVWGTIWWSATPDRDFGLDRPRNLPQGLGSYKLCVSTTFMEMDDMPADERFVSTPELATVMEHATWRDGPMGTGAGLASWCANPYIEGPFHQKTCIGCHQPAGDVQVNNPSSASNIRNVTRHLGDFAFTFYRLRQMARNLLSP